MDGHIIPCSIHLRLSICNNVYPKASDIQYSRAGRVQGIFVGTRAKARDINTTCTLPFFLSCAAASYSERRRILLNLIHSRKSQAGTCLCALFQHAR